MSEKLKAYIFQRRTGGSSTPEPKNGHTGWAFQASDGSFICGSTENPTAKEDGTGNDKGFWMEQHPESNLVSVFARSRSFKIGGKTYTAPAYDQYRILVVSPPKPSEAKQKAVWCGNQPFKAVGAPFQRGRNCLDDAYDIITAYGKGDLPWPSDPRYWIPNNWFDALTEKVYPVR